MFRSIGRSVRRLLFLAFCVVMDLVNELGLVGSAIAALLVVSFLHGGAHAVTTLAGASMALAHYDRGVHKAVEGFHRAAKQLEARAKGHAERHQGLVQGSIQLASIGTGAFLTGVYYGKTGGGHEIMKKIPIPILFVPLFKLAAWWFGGNGNLGTALNGIAGGILGTVVGRWGVDAGESWVANAKFATKGRGGGARRELTPENAAGALPPGGVGRSAAGVTQVSKEELAQQLNLLRMA